MKLDRRHFLSFGIGTTVGIGLSPLPWKLTDDLSIWTQTWPWTPVPERGEVTYAKTVCTLCDGGCGLSVRKVNNRAVKVEGLDGYPGNDGKACPLGLSAVQLLYGHAVVKSPMKKVEDRWEEISWGEAVGLVAEKLKVIREEDPAALACIADSDCGTVPRLFQRFLTAFGSPNFMRTTSYRDSYEMTARLMQGVDASVGFDLENADMVVSFGSGIIEGWGNMARMIGLHGKWKDEGIKLVQVEPRLSNTAVKAGQWLRVEPGTEGLLALAMASVIIREGLYDKAFVETHGFGFEDWKDSHGNTQKGLKSILTKGFDHRRVAGKIGVSAKDIETLAREFAKAERPIAICGRGKGDRPGALHDFLAVHALNGLVGSINRKGGICAFQRDDYINWPPPKFDDIAEKGLKTPRVDGAGTDAYPHTKYLTTRLATVVTQAETSPVRALFVYDSNPCYTLPDTEAVKAAFERIPFVVAFTAYMDETAEMADIILPIPTHLQRLEDVPTPFGMNQKVTGLSRPVVEDRHAPPQAGDTLILLAGKLGGSVAESFPWKSYDACLKETLGPSLKPMQKEGFIASAIQPLDFKTPSGKFQFMSEACSYEGGAMHGAVGIDGEESGYPLLLIPYAHPRLASGPVADTPFMMKTLPNSVLTDDRTWVEMNPATAGKWGLAEGVCAKIKTARGQCTVRVHLNAGLTPGVIAMPTGLGHFAEADPYMAGKGVNVNAVMGPVEDPVSGLDATVGIRASMVIA